MRGGADRSGRLRRRQSTLVLALRFPRLSRDTRAAQRDGAQWRSRLGGGPGVSKDSVDCSLGRAGAVEARRRRFRAEDRITDRSGLAEAVPLSTEDLATLVSHAAHQRPHALVQGGHVVERQALRAGRSASEASLRGRLEVNGQVWRRHALEQQPAKLEKHRAFVVAV